ncbi:MAG: sensor histidine kinase [Saprospiraceae bacterium]|nr:sensor histidine kinase [Saprospiraceae bacterium]
MEGQIDVFLFLFVGMLTLALLAGAVVLFFFFYQKKMLRQQLQISEMEIAHREELLHKNIEQVESERHRIATDLHDELGGIFSTLKLKINHLDRENNLERLIAESREIIDTGIASVRRISHSMTPPGLEMFGLSDALTSLFQKNDGPQLNVDFVCSPDFPRLESKIELGLYRMAQELLNNSIRHAEASKILLNLSHLEREVIFEFSDNGKGFDPAILQSRSGLGLKNIEARANYLNATVEWQTQPGEGLKTIVKVPYEV